MVTHILMPTDGSEHSEKAVVRGERFWGRLALNLKIRRVFDPANKSARTLQRILQEKRLIAVPATVVNKPGGGGAVGWTYLNQHTGDAHHLEVGNPTLLTNQIVDRSTLSYADITPIAMLFSESVAFSVREESPIKSGRDLLERLRKDAGSVSVSVGSSLGSTNHIAIAAVAKAAGGDPKQVKAVVFQGGGEAITALLGGHVDLIASAANNVVGHVAAGKLRVIAVTAPQRLGGSLAVVPTWREQGVDTVVTNWRMVAGSKGMTQPQIVYWEGVFARLVDTAEWQKRSRAERVREHVHEEPGNERLPEVAIRQLQSRAHRSRNGEVAGA